jgi:hypothetical protein
MAWGSLAQGPPIMPWPITCSKVDSDTQTNQNCIHSDIESQRLRPDLTDLL